MNGNFKNSERFRPQVIRSVGGLGLALLLAACASTTVPIASPLGSAGPASGKAAQRSGAGGSGDSSVTGAGGAAANGGGAANEFNAATGNDGSPANGFDIRRADGKGGSNGDARGDAMGADDSNGMGGAGGNGSRSGGSSTGNGDVGAGGGAGGAAGAGANGLADGSDSAGAAGRRKGSASGNAAGANPAGGPNGTSGTPGASGKSADAGSAGGAGAAGGRAGTNAAGSNVTGSNAAGGNGAGGKGGADDDPARIAMARDGSAAGGNGDGAAERRGRVETGHGGVDIDRDERSVTLGGALPTSLGMGEGQFEFDRFSLSDDVKAKLDTITEKLGSEPYDKLYVTGYSDRIGDADYNKKLSEKRAWAVAGYLMDKGIPPEKLKVEGKGEANSLVAGGECMALKRAELIQCLERDRRVELLATVKEYNLKVK